MTQYKLKPVLGAMILNAFTLFTGNAQANLVFDITYDPSITASEKNAVNYAANALSALITNNITVNVNVGIDKTTTSTGYALPNTDYYSYASVEAAINKNFGSNIMPANDPIADNRVEVAQPEARALGLLTTTGGSDGSVYFGNYNWGTNPNSIAANAYDMIGTAEHELSHILGRMDSNLDGSPLMPLDLFRFTAQDVPSLNVADSNPDTGVVYFSVDQGKTNLHYFAPASYSDPADWWNGDIANDAFLTGSSEGAMHHYLSASDVTEMNAIGFSIAALPLPNSVWLFLSGALGLLLNHKRGK